MTDEARRRAGEHDIARLIHHYAWLTDQHRWEALTELYARDGAMRRPTAPDTEIRGREAILAAFLERPPRATQHVCFNIVVTMTGEDTADAVSGILLFAGQAAQDGGLPMMGGAPLVGAYEDRLVREDGVWRFAERRGRLTFRK